MYAKSSRRQKRRLISSKDMNVKDFNNYDKIVDYIDRISAEHPSIAEKLEIGETFEGRKLIGIKIGSSLRKYKPAIFIDGGVHAREWIAPAAATFLIDKVSNQ